VANGELVQIAKSVEFALFERMWVSGTGWQSLKLILVNAPSDKAAGS
jgi:hypothetical protein